MIDLKTILLTTLALSACVSLPLPEQSDPGPAVQADCIQLTPESSLHLVGVCQREAKYEFLVEDQVYRYEQHVWEESLRTALYYGIRETSYPIDNLKGSSIDVWLVAPTFDPGRPYLVAVLGGDSAQTFAVRLPLNPRKWVLKPAVVTLLNKGKYPEFWARQSGKLLIVLKPGLTPDSQEINNWFLQEGLDPPPKFDSLIEITVPMFTEAVVARKLQSATWAERYLYRLSYVPAGFQDGSRKKFTTVAFSQ